MGAERGALTARPHAADRADPGLVEPPSSGSGEAVGDAVGEAVGEAVGDVVSEARLVEEQMRQAEKMESISRLTARIAHDFNDILTIVISKADLLADAVPREEGQLRADLEDIRRAARRGADMTDKMLSFARRRRLRPGTVDVARVVGGTAPTLERLLPESVGFVTRTTGGGPFHVQADAGALQQILLNLVTNARDAMAGGGVLTIAVERLTRLAGAHEMVCLAVTDTGTGIAEEIRDRVFEPFFTTKDAGRGSGLGLATVYGLVRQQGGAISVRSAPGRGTTVRVELPAAPEAPKGAATAATGSAGRILVAEDEEVILRASRRVLERHGYTVLQADDGAEALDQLLEYGNDIDLVISDIVMPELDGLALYRAARARGVESPFLFMSGYQNEEVLDTIGSDPDLAFLPKPWSVPQFVASVRKSLRKAPSHGDEISG